MSSSSCISFCIVFALLLSGCTTTAQLKAQPSSQQSVRYLDGKPLFVSSGKTEVSVLHGSEKFESESRIKMVVAVANGGMTPFNFSPADISFEVSGERLRVYTYDELLAEQKSKETWAAVAIALSGVSNAMAASDAGYSYTSGTVTTRGYGGAVHGTYSGYTYDASKAAAARAHANAQNRANFSALEESSRQARTQLQNEILKLNTVMPNSFVGGVVVLDIAEPQETRQSAVLKVRAGDEVHEFLFDYSKVK